MTDIARLGFSAETGDLDKAAAKLNTLVPAAQKAEKATTSFNNAAAGISRSTNGAATGINSFANAVNQAAVGTAGVDKAALGAGTAMGTVQRAAAGASSGINGLDAVVNRLKGSMGGVTPAVNNAKSSLDRLGKSANDNINKLQSTPGNIAAQFQDIGVTAAGGMQPYLIALQQGTQLSAAMQGGIGNLAAAFGQLFSPLSLTVIGLVGVVAALIQSVNWTNVAKSALNGLADAMQVAAPYALGLGAVLLLAFAPQIITSVVGLTRAIAVGLFNAFVSATAAASAFLLANPFTALVLAATVAAASISYLIDGSMKPVRNAVNFIIGSFVGAYNAIKKTWSMLPAAIGDSVITTVNTVVRYVDELVNRSVASMNGLIAKLPGGLGDKLQISFRANSGQLANPNAGAARAVNDVARGEIAAAQKTDYVGKAVKFVVDGAAAIGAKLRSFADGLGKDDKKKKTRKGGKTDADRFQDIVEGAQNDIAKEKARADAVQLTAEAAATLEQRTKLLNQANSAGIKLTDAMRAKIDQLASAYGAAKVQADRLIATRELNSSANAELARIKAETDQIGLYGRALYYAQQQARLLAEAKEKFKNDPEGFAAFAKGIPATAGKMADAQAQQDSTRFMEEQRRANEERIIGLDNERTALGLAGPVLTAFRVEQELLAQARQRNIDLSPTELATLREYALAQASAEEQTRRMRDSLDFSRDSVRGFVSDLRSGLDQGKSLFSTFADSVINVLNKVIDKLLDVALQAALDGGKSGGVAGFIQGIGSSFASTFGGGNARASAEIGARAQAGLRSVGFAKGGAFTNSIVSTPTIFRYANGGKFGEMGEAGPEAIVPLKRGSDGSLGVAVHGGRGANDNARATPQINVNNHYHIQGSSTADMQATVRQSAEQTRDQLRREIPSVLQEYQMNGTVN